ncbi:AzlD domain-containing protein [Desulfonema ishimotonii]|uniref:AzlD domain-containing protein n=1 Tax=Desulfonema ishimotonii TaxID=45657 RepID=A0A401FVV0_9BACT|nr:AzlD domain-containing protein [Desulfonema ishimotonii]GBC61090.1 AzlD domain-containing protein [Desulfonema ishimotonii]
MLTNPDSHITVLLTIGCAALVTYSLRIGGLLLSDRLPQSGRFKRFMDALPGTILLSLIAPGIASAGFWGGVGALCTAICTYKTRNVFLAMLIGVGIVAISRQLSP